MFSVKSHPRHCRSLWRPASAVQTPSLTRHKPVVAIPSLGPQEAPITHPRDGTRRQGAAEDGWFWELPLAAKWGPFTSGERGQVTVIVGLAPQGNEAADSCSGPGSHPRPEPRHKLGAVFHAGNPRRPPEDRSIHRGRSMMLRGRCRLWLLTNEEPETRGPWKNYPRSLGSWMRSSRTSCLRRGHTLSVPSRSLPEVFTASHQFKDCKARSHLSLKTQLSFITHLQAEPQKP